MAPIQHQNWCQILPNFLIYTLSSFCVKFQTKFIKWPWIFIWMGESSFNNGTYLLCNWRYFGENCQFKWFILKFCTFPFGVTRINDNAHCQNESRDNTFVVVQKRWFSKMFAVFWLQFHFKAFKWFDHSFEIERKH